MKTHGIDELKVYGRKSNDFESSIAFLTGNPYGSTY